MEVTGWFFGMGLLAILFKVLLFILLIVSIYGVFVSFRHVSPYRHRSYLTYRKHRLRKFLLSCLLVPRSEHTRYKERQRLLDGCGLPVEAGYYLAVCRLLMLAALTTAAWTVMASVYWPGLISRMERFVIISVSMSLLVVITADKPILEKLGQIRRYRVMKDVDVLSRQLLYYSGVSGNLHGKLMRCLPFVSAVRAEWYQLTSDWYQNADMALRRFRERVATEEGRSFADTLNVLRQYDHDRYYELLRQRIADYKEKLELFKESRRESLSYLLFVMSGVPILYTFRLFVYPWVAGGQKLFDSLG